MNAVWVLLVILIFAAFAVSFTEPFKGMAVKPFKSAVRALRHAVFFAPAIAGGEGFALPAPFFIAAPLNASLPKLLPLHVLAPFAVTWLLVFLGRHLMYNCSFPGGKPPQDAGE